jgi:hypothetical protein
VGIPLTVGFRPQLVVAPAFLWESLWRWDLGFHGAIGYHGAHSRSFLSHNGISAITKSFTNFSFTRWNSGYHEAFHEFFLSHDRVLAITEPFTNFSFTRWNAQDTWSGGRLFSYISQRVFT